MSTLNETDDLDADFDVDQDTTTKKVEDDIVLKPKTTSTTKIPNRFMALIDATMDEDDTEPVLTQPSLDLKGLPGEMPNLDIDFKIVTNDAVKVIQLQEIESAILCNESICKSDALTISMVREEFSSILPINQFTDIPTKVNYNSTVNYLKNTIGTEKNQLVSGSKLILDSLVGGHSKLLDGFDGAFMDEQKSFFKRLKASFSYLDKLLLEPTKVKNVVFTNKEEFVNILRTPIKELSTTIDGTKLDLGTDEDAQAFKDSVKILAVALDRPGILFLLCSSIGRFKDQCLNINIEDQSYNLLNTVAGEFTILDLCEFYSNETYLSRLTTVRELIRSNLNTLSSWSDFVVNDPENTANLFTKQVDQILAIKNRTKYTLEVIEVLPSINHAFIRIAKYIKLCLPEGFAT